MNFNSMHVKAKPFTFKGDVSDTKELVGRHFEEPNGTLLQSNDNYGRRVLVLAGTSSNIVVLDRYPDIQTSMYMVYAIPEVLNQLPPILRNENMATLTGFIKDL